MEVTIPKVSEHAGFGGALRTYKISDNCPKCGKKRGRVFGTHSFDGSRRLNVDGWKNPCGHIDKYSSVRDEGEIIDYKEPTKYDKYADEEE